jgi:hypothetical protein
VGVGKGPWPDAPCDAHCGSAREVVWLLVEESWCGHGAGVEDEEVSAHDGEEGSYL